MVKFYWICYVGRNRKFSQTEKGNCFFVITSIFLISFPISFFKLRNVVIENKNTLNIQYFCLKCKKLNGYKAEER